MVLEILHYISQMGFTLRNFMKALSRHQENPRCRRPYWNTVEYIVVEARTIGISIQYKWTGVLDPTKLPTLLVLQCF